MRILDIHESNNPNLYSCKCNGTTNRISATNNQYCEYSEEEERYCIADSIGQLIEFDFKNLHNDWIRFVLNEVINETDVNKMNIIV